MALNNSNLNRLFVYVPNAQVATFKETVGKTAAYTNRISFLGSTGEIMTNGEIFGINRNEDITALQQLLGATAQTLSGNLGFNASTIVGAIKYVYDQTDARLDIIEGTGEGSIRKAVDDAIIDLINGAPNALDTLKEIADWISRDGADAANLITRMESIESQVEENEEVTAKALIDLQEQIDSMTGGNGSIQEQIDRKVDTLDSSVTLAGSTASQPQNVGIDTSVDVLGSVTISETDGKLDAEALGKSAKVVLQADAAGAARKAFDVLYGDVQTDTTDSMTLVGVRSRIDYLRRTGTLSISNQLNRTLEFDNSQDSHLVTGENLRDTINSIEMWETYSAN